jgi:uncharacterized SAM-binding protein YcdF (DUF218 family)
MMRSEGETSTYHRTNWGGLASALGLCARAVLLAGIIAVTGLIVFAGLIDDTPPGAPRSSDGIVVLTGGDSRITEAIRLLAEGHAKRLLISGVHPQTTRDMLSKVNPESDQLFACCIDLDRNATDTISNANETRQWIEERGFTSLIVVTSSYHMPRSLVELRRVLPHTELVPYPVTPTQFRIDEWTVYRGTFRLVLSEYVKFTAALANCAITRLVAGNGALHGVTRCFFPAAD